MNRKQEKVSVLLVEDDPMVQEVNKQFIEQVPGFEVVGIANNGQDGVNRVKNGGVDLIILDIYMPEMSGIDTLEQIRKLEVDVDIIAITAASDQTTIKKMLQLGALDYIIKPFKYERLKQTLERYLDYKKQLSNQEKLNQETLDQWTVLRNQSISVTQEDLPKGLNEQTLNEILNFLSDQSTAVSAEKTADAIGIARVTARRYLDYLQQIGKVRIDLQYGNVGRPLNRYMLV